MNAPPDWRPSASAAVLRKAARMRAAARRYLDARGVLEVITPALQERTVTDVHIESITARSSSWPGKKLFLHTSPEYRMKALLAAHDEDIYQICNVYRDGDLGRNHHPEFTLLEWYRRHLDLDAIIDETIELITAMAQAAESRAPAVTHERYTELFRRVTGLAPDAELGELVARAQRMAAVEPADVARIGFDRGAWLDLLFGHVVSRELGDAGLVVVTHYPACHAALARLAPEDPAVAERFEVFWDGLELANGYRELTDPEELRSRFARDRAARAARGQDDIAVDEDLLAAMARGLPECCGVAIGLDRLLMRAAGLDSLAQALSFTLI